MFVPFIHYIFRSTFNRLEYINKSKEIQIIISTFQNVINFRKIFNVLYLEK